MGRWRRAQSAQRQCLISHSSSGRFGNNGKLSKERRSAYREVVQLTRGELAGFARRRATRNEAGHALSRRQGPKRSLWSRDGAEVSTRGAFSWWMYCLSRLSAALVVVLTGSSSSVTKEKHNTALEYRVVSLKTLNALTLGVWR